MTAPGSARTASESGVDPAEIARQRALGWPDMHPEDFCHTCGRPNPTWFADTVEWQTATGSTGDGGGILCPSCFCALYRRLTGKTAIIWRLSIDPRSRDAAPPAAEGTDELLDDLVRIVLDWSWDPNLDPVTEAQAAQLRRLLAGPLAPLLAARTDAEALAAHVLAMRVERDTLLAKVQAVEALAESFPAQVGTDEIRRALGGTR